jgi:alpha-D-ribose 1-methylphosphonate 5-triphosphate synthase subunit PhnG
MKYDNDYVLCECELAPLQELVIGLEQQHDITIVKEPSVCLTMIRAEDSLEQQPFYLGEALTTECEVTVDGRIGYGVCLGDEPVRGYCLAVVDALMADGDAAHASVEAINPFIERQRGLVAEKETEEFNLVLRTQVDFKLMEQE